MSGSGGRVDLDEISNDEGQVWAADIRDLEGKLEDYYGVDGLRLRDSYHDEEEDESFMEAFTYFDGDEQHLLVEFVPVFGHGPSGAAGVDVEDLPTRGEVTEVVG